MPAIGSHCILELYGCPGALLDDEAAVLAALHGAAAQAHATALGVVSHRFAPHGVTALILLGDSHMSVHTWPELGYAACDVFTCGGETEPEAACQALAEALAAATYHLHRVPRGAEASLPAPARRPATDEVA